MTQELREKILTSKEEVIPVEKSTGEEADADTEA